MRRSRISVYQSRKHLVITLFVVALPFLFLLWFSQFSGIATSRLFSDIGISLTRLIIAYVISAGIAWVLAVSFYHGRRAVIALPFFDILQSFPTFAVVPLAVLTFGKTNATIIFFLVITIIWPILFSIISSLKLIKHDWEEAAEISGLRGINYVRHFLWPISVPGLITGSIIGLGEGWEALVATELIMGIQMGLGNFFDANASHGETIALGVLGLLIIIFSINKLLWLPLLEASHHRMEE